MSKSSEILKALGFAGAPIGASAAIHGSGLGSLLEPLDYPRQALYNTFASPLKALETGDYSDLLGAIPGVAGGVLGGVVGGPLGVLAGSALGGALQGIGKQVAPDKFKAPEVSDITGTEDWLPNMAVGMATDPLTYAGLSPAWRAGKAALGAKGVIKAAEEVTPMAKAVEQTIPVAKVAPSRSDAVVRDILAEQKAGRWPEGNLTHETIDPDKLMGSFKGHTEESLSNMLEGDANLGGIRKAIQSGQELDPVVARRYSDGRLQVLDGEHRTAAHGLEGKPVPAVVINEPKEIGGKSIKPIPNPQAASGQSFGIFEGDKLVKSGFASEEQAATHLDRMQKKSGIKKPAMSHDEMVSRYESLSDRADHLSDAEWKEMNDLEKKIVAKEYADSKATEPIAPAKKKRGGGIDYRNQA